jgi:disulfide bond formation protein DsbB
MNVVPFVNQILGISTLLGGILVLLILGSLVSKDHSVSHKLHTFIAQHAILLSFCIASISMLGSLFYSEIVGYDPCKLCWYQRIFMYPQVFLLGYAYRTQDKKVIPYALLLSLIGGSIALYHYLLQLGIAPELPCSAVGASISCSKQFVLQWGYISIPVMALTAFVLMSSFLIIGLRKGPSKK